MYRLDWVRDVREGPIAVQALTDEGKHALAARATNLLRHAREDRSIDHVIVLPINTPAAAALRFQDIADHVQNLDLLVLELYGSTLRDVCGGEGGLNSFRDNFNKELTAAFMVRVRDAFHGFGWPARHMREKSPFDGILLDLVSRVERVYHALAYLSVGFAIHADRHPIQNAFTEDAEAGFFPACLPVGIHVPPRSENGSDPVHPSLVVLAMEVPPPPSEPPKVLEFI